MRPTPGTLPPVAAPWPGPTRFSFAPRSPSRAVITPQRGRGDLASPESTVHRPQVAYPACAAYPAGELCSAYASGSIDHETSPQPANREASRSVMAAFPACYYIMGYYPGRGGCQARLRPMPGESPRRTTGPRLAMEPAWPWNPPSARCAGGLSSPMAFAFP